jgi:hypothetical protein
VKVSFGTLHNRKGLALAVPVPPGPDTDVEMIVAETMLGVDRATSNTIASEPTLFIPDLIASKFHKRVRENRTRDLLNVDTVTTDKRKIEE